MTAPHILDIERHFKDCLAHLGHPLDDNIVFDNENWRRFDCPTSAKHNKNASYRAHSDLNPVPVLKFECHKCSIKENFAYTECDSSKITPSEYAEIQLEAAKRKLEQETRSQVALKIMRAQWDSAKPCVSHAYFDRKLITLTAADGLRLDSFGDILCPARLITGEVITTQTIPARGKKRFYTGIPSKNGFHVFGTIEPDQDIYFAEGIATAKTISESTKDPVICVYGKRFNSIAPIIAKAHPNSRLIYCCDLPSDGEVITSENNARRAIALVGGHICLPDFSNIPHDFRPEIKRSDYNDLLVLLITNGLNRTAALDIVRQQLSIHFDERIMAENTQKTKGSKAQEEKPKMAELLLELIDQEDYEFFHDEHEDTFCKYPSQRSNVYETRRLNDSKFKSYLSFIFRKSEGKTIGEQALKEALAEMEGRALHDIGSKQQKIFIRVGTLNEKIYIDLCNDKWQVIEISTIGWKILESKDVPIRFVRPQHSLPLPDPTSANMGDISKLWEMVNIPKEDQILLLAFILECFRCTTAFPILVLLGLQDSGKSATQNTIRSLIDPSSSNLRTAPRKTDDLVTEAGSNWLVSYNNMSNITDDMHDDFCCISTGSGFATRKYWTNTQQVVVNIARPVVMNGIYNFIRRPDLLDRAIILELDSIDDSNRKTDSQLDKAALHNRPIIFRGLIDLLVKVLALLPTVTLDRQPRMADFALLGIAVEQAQGLPQHTFITRYRANRADAKDSVLESSPVMLALIEFIETQDNNFWRGRPSDLLEKLTSFKTPSLHTTWPKSPHAMAGDLKRYIAPLQGIGINVINEAKIENKKNKKGNFYQISKIADIGKTCPPYPPSPIGNQNINSYKPFGLPKKVDYGRA